MTEPTKANIEFVELMDDLYPTQTAFAKEIGMNIGHITRIKKGEVEPTTLLLQYLRLRRDIRALEAKNLAAKRLADAVRELAGQPCDQ